MRADDDAKDGLDALCRESFLGTCRTEMPCGREDCRFGSPDTDGT